VRKWFPSPAVAVITVRTIAAGKQDTRLEPGASGSYDVIWDQKDGEGVQVPPGQYYIEVVVAAKGALADDTLESRMVTISVLIQPQ